MAKGEARAVFYFLGLFLLLGAGFALGRGSAGSLFLQRYGVERLPHAMAALAVAIALASFAYAALADRIRPDRLLTGIFCALLATLLPLWAAMGWSDAELAYPAYFVVFHTASEILLLQVTLYFALSFDNTQSKRLLPLALAGLQAGEMGGGLALTALASRVPMQHIAALWSFLILLGACLVVLRHWGGRDLPHMSPARRSSRPWRAAAAQIVQGTRFSRASPLLRNLALATLCMVIAVQTLEYATFVIYSSEFRSEEELGIVFGLLTFTCGAITLFTQLFFSGRLLRRHGVRTMNLVFPVGLLAVFGALAASFRVPSALAGSVVQRTLMPAMRNPSRALLFQALPDHIQGRARALSLAVVLPVGILIAALLVRSVPGHAQFWMLPVVGLIASAGYLAFSLVTNARYPEALLDTLGDRLFVAGGHIGRLDQVRDRALIARFAEGIRHADDEVACAYAQAMAEAMPGEAWRYILDRAREARPAVRDRLVRLVGGDLPPAQRSALRSLLNAGDEHQRATVLSALFTARDPESVEDVAACLRSSNPRMAACGIQGALDYPIADLLPGARARWRELLASPEPTHRLAGLELARARPEREWVALVIESTTHADERVRRSALATLEAHAPVGGGALAPWVRNRLAARNPEARTVALRCAIDLPEDERLAFANAALGDPHPTVSRAAVGLLADHHGTSFTSVAFDRLADDALELRAQRNLLVWLLANSPSQRRLAGFAMRRSQEAQDLAILLHTLRRSPADARAHWTGELVVTAVEERALECLDLALHALEAVEDPLTVRRIRAAVASRDARHLARAMEALQELRHREVALALRRTLECIRGDALFEAPAGRGHQTFAQVIDYLSQYPDAFLRECALRSQRDAMVLPA